MMNKTLKLYTTLLCSMIVIVLTIMAITIGVFATNSNDDPVIIVSLGDSYSSGEGIEPFYGQDKSGSDKCYDLNWVCHRSEKSWGSLLKFPNTEILTGSKFVDVQSDDGNASSYSAYQWYFVACSGATVENVNATPQTKSVSKRISLREKVEYDASIPAQLDVFNDISGDVDYVTITIGGNDLGFSDIITSCVTSCSFLNNGSLYKQMNVALSKIEQTSNDLTELYNDIAEAAGEQACILVAGYPELLDYSGKGAIFNQEEATVINEAVRLFNQRIEVLVAQCRIMDGLNIYYVDVESEFTDHQAYSDDSWINGIDLVTNDEDITDGMVSAYSIHPNAKGAEAYARCVNAKIAEIESTKVNYGTLSGMVCKASDRTTPIGAAVISIYSGDTLYSACTSSSTGNYTIFVPEGDYKVVISADGYISFTAYVTVTADTVTYTETYLMVQGAVGTTGAATGTITSALTGTGVSGVSLVVREGWDNTSVGDVITTVTTGSSGAYSVTLPIGNYTMYATKDGYIATSINIVVQAGTTSSQNGSISPIISGDNFRVVLTWGANPRDLDSHVVGTLSNGSSFHTYFAKKSAYDGSVEVCNLDVDDTTSYGPETITLQLTTSNPYYYYIYLYAGTGSLATSEAQINLYQGDTLVATFNVPTDQGSGRYWNVFAIVDGQLTVRNTITSSADVSYASTSGISVASIDLDLDVDESKDGAEEEDLDEDGTIETIIEYVE